jgi:transcriptional repressor NrdR
VRCPRCKADDTRVVDSREAEEGASIRRRRQCTGCDTRFTTYERLEEAPLIVAKSTGDRQPFDRAKLVAGVTAAAKGRPVSGDDIERLADEVEDAARAAGGDVASSQLGVAVLRRLSDLDEVAYLRFASVYKNFDAAADFQRELVTLKKLQRADTP